MHNFGLTPGYEDSPRLRGQVHKMKSDDKPVRQTQVRLIDACFRGYRPKDWPVENEWRSLRQNLREFGSPKVPHGLFVLVLSGSSIFTLALNPAVL